MRNTDYTELLEGPGLLKTHIHSKTHKIKPLQLLQIGQWLSVDVALGTICSSAMICKLLHVAPIPWFSLFILAGTVLLIYTLDHLWDVAHMPVKPVSQRHRFHWQYKYQLWIFACVLAAVLGLAALLYLPVSIIYFGMGLGSLVALYLWLVNSLKSKQGKKWFHKEICIAVLYTAGVWGVAWIQATQVNLVDWLLMFCFCLIAFQNLLLFSNYELEEDILQGQRSVVQILGRKGTKNVLLCSFLIFTLTASVINHLSKEPIIQRVLVTLTIMSAALFLLFCFPDYFRKNHRYRWIGDSVFLMPVWLLLNKGLFT